MSDLDHTDALAAEYVLGTLDADERMQARALLNADGGFAAKVQVWERRFGELYLMVEPVEPDARIWARIKAKMPDVQPRPAIRVPEPQIPEPAPPAPPVEAPPPSLDAIQAAISQATTALTSEATPASSSGATPAPGSEATPDLDATMTSAPETVPAVTPDAAPAPASEAVAMPTSEEVPLPSGEAAPSSTPVEPVASPPFAPPPTTAAAVPPPMAERSPPIAAGREVVIHRRLRRWRAVALLMALLIAALAALLAAWKFAPDQVPLMLQPAELMRQMGVTVPAAPAPRRRTPLPSQFDE